MTSRIEQAANEILAGGNREVHRIDYEAALSSPETQDFDFVSAYVDGLADIIDMKLSPNPV